MNEAAKNLQKFNLKLANFVNIYGQKKRTVPQVHRGLQKRPGPRGAAARLPLERARFIRPIARPFKSRRLFAPLRAFTVGNWSLRLCKYRCMDREISSSCGRVTALLRRCLSPLTLSFHYFRTERPSYSDSDPKREERTCLPLGSGKSSFASENQ